MNLVEGNQSPVSIDENSSIHLSIVASIVEKKMIQITTKTHIQDKGICGIVLCLIVLESFRQGDFAFLRLQDRTGHDRAGQGRIEVKR